MPAVPLGSLGAAEASIAKHAGNERAHGPVWVLEDVRCGREDACIAIAERLGTEFRRLTLAWNWQGTLASLSTRGSLAGLKTSLPLQGGPPALTFSSGRRAAAVAAWLKQSAGSRMIHYGPAGGHVLDADLHVLNRKALAPMPPSVFPVLGAPHRLSPLMLAELRSAWRERLDHLPHPLLALNVGSGAFGAELQPSEAFRLGRSLAAAARSANGAVLAVADKGTGREATDALGAGLADCLHLLYRTGEPGPDATHGFMAVADVIVIAGSAPQRLLEACATEAAVYIAPTGAMTGTMRRLVRRLLAAGQIRQLSNSIESWTRPKLDEAGRAAQAIRARCLLST